MRTPGGAPLQAVTTRLLPRPVDVLGNDTNPLYCRVSVAIFVMHVPMTDHAVPYALRLKRCYYSPTTLDGVLTRQVFRHRDQNCPESLLEHGHDRDETGSPVRRRKPRIRSPSVY